MKTISRSNRSQQLDLITELVVGRLRKRLTQINRGIRYSDLLYLVVSYESGEDLFGRDFTNYSSIRNRLTPYMKRLKAAGIYRKTKNGLYYLKSKK